MSRHMLKTNELFYTKYLRYIINFLGVEFLYCCCCCCWINWNKILQIFMRFYTFLVFPDKCFRIAEKNIKWNKIKWKKWNPWTFFKAKWRMWELRVGKFNALNISNTNIIYYTCVCPSFTKRIDLNKNLLFICVTKKKNREKIYDFISSKF